ncbi:MAG: hypothetical protein ACR2JM_14230 [Mycobacterium sp.]
MRGVIVAMPLWSITAVLFLFFSAVSLLARRFVRRRRDADDREAASEQAKSLLTGVAATFAFFVGFAINVTWGAATAGQIAVEQQAAALHQMAWEIGHIDDPAQSAALMGKLRTYATTAAEQDDDFLRRGQTTNLPSLVPLDDFENALHAYVGSSKTAGWQASALASAGSALSTSSAGVAAVANRALPRPLAVLVTVVGVLASIVMGVTTVVYERATLVFVWCLIPAMSITVVLALAYPFALRSGGNLAPLRAVAAQIAGTANG